MIKKITFISIFFLHFFNVSSLYSINSNYNKNTLKARELIFNFQFIDAKNILDNDKTAISFYLKSYSFFIQNLLIGGDNNYKKFTNNFDDIVDKLNDLEDNDKQKNLLLSEVYLQSSILELMNKDFISGSLHFVKSYGFLEDQIKQYPNLKENKKLIGLYKIIAGITPDQGKKFLKMIGLEGNILDGYKDLNEYLINTQQKKDFYIEAYSLNLLIHTFLKENLGNKDFKFHLVNKEKNLKNPSVLFSNILKNYKFGQINLLQSNIKTLNKNIPILYYFLGVSQTTKNTKQASVNLLKYISKTKNKNFIKASYWQLARISVLTSDNSSFEKYKDLTILKGVSFTAADNQALNEASEELKPNKILLKARLLFDAQKYNEALVLLKKYKLENFKTNEEKAEYYYRLGRIEYEKENYGNSKIYFSKVLKNYIDVNKYYIPYSALELAYIYQKEKNIKKQEIFFKKALELNKSEYQNSIKQKANSGLKQLKNN